MSQTTIMQQLFALQDPAYQSFQAKLIPTIDPACIIGVRTPALRALARELQGSPEASVFLSDLPHRYYDENMLHGCLLSAMRDYGQTVAAVEAFLPYLDNWATCDLLSPKVFRKNLPDLYQHILVWLQSGHVYTVRFGIGMLLSFYLDEAFHPDMLALVANLRSQEYYINMMIAWYFATALAKQPAVALPYIEQHKLGLWVHNKTIQKAIESRRITEKTKTYLRSLRIK